MLSKIECEQTPMNPSFFQSQSTLFQENDQFQQDNSFLSMELKPSKSEYQLSSDHNSFDKYQIQPLKIEIQEAERTPSSRQNTIKQNYETWKKGMPKNKNMEKNLAFIGKMMFCILAFAVLVGIMAVKIEQTIQEEPKGRPLNKDDSEVLNRLYKTKSQVVTKIEDLESVYIEENDDNSLRKLSLQKNLQKQEMNAKSDAQSEIQKETPNIQVQEIAKNDISITETVANDKVLSENIGIQTKQISENKKENQEQSLTGKLKINIIQNIADLQSQKQSSKKIQQNSPIQPLPQQNENKQNPKVAQQNPSIQPLVRQNSINNLQSIQIQVENPKFQVEFSEQSCNTFIRQQNQKFGRLYQFSVNRNMFRANSNVNSFFQRVPTKITKDKYVEAVSLLQSIHHVDPSGKIVAEDTPCETGEATIKRLNETIQKQNQRLNETYQIDSYFNNQLRFCIVTNSYKNAQNGLIYRNLDSILQQNYTNYHVVYTDDFSPDNTGQIVKKYLAEKNVSEDKIKVKINQQKLGMMENIYNAITYDCELGEIAVMLDGDDSLIGTHVLSFLNAVYQKRKLALMWNNFLQINDNSRAMMGFSKDLQNFQNNYQAYRRSHMFVSSHLKSFYVDLFRKIKQFDLQQNDGKFFGGASDTAMMMAMLQMAHPRFQYVPEVVYEYRFDTGQVGMYTNRAAQYRALTKIGFTEPYESLKDFSFIDEAILKAKKQN